MVQYASSVLYGPSVWTVIPFAVDALSFMVGTVLYCKCELYTIPVAVPYVPSVRVYRAWEHSLS